MWRSVCGFFDIIYIRVKLLQQTPVWNFNEMIKHSLNLFTHILECQWAIHPSIDLIYEEAIKNTVDRTKILFCFNFSWNQKLRVPVLVLDPEGTSLNYTANITPIQLFHDGGPYHIETDPLICSANGLVSVW